MKSRAILEWTGAQQPRSYRSSTSGSDGARSYGLDSKAGHAQPLDLLALEHFRILERQNASPPFDRKIRREF